VGGEKTLCFFKFWLRHARLAAYSSCSVRLAICEIYYSRHRFVHSRARAFFKPSFSGMPDIQYAVSNGIDFPTFSSAQLDFICSFIVNPKDKLCMYVKHAVKAVLCCAAWHGSLVRVARCKLDPVVGSSPVWSNHDMLFVSNAPVICARALLNRDFSKICIVSQQHRYFY